MAEDLYTADTSGTGRAPTRLFYRVPPGAGVCGPCIMPDNRMLFLAIQHPGEDGGPSFEKSSNGRTSRRTGAASQRDRDRQARRR
ncbi:alkaline phosphatase PhoX [Roseomonas sp. BN140053]|uniref:alkaline phosphatase PhoX n=1 Tax=Roseomonas sp. BN140053 TaxID=3391898 RepID=UPI0039EA13CE